MRWSSRRLFATALALGLGTGGAAAFGCGSGARYGSADATTDAIAVPDACAGLPCGTACKGDNECAAGLYCAAGACRADCSPTAPCPEGSCSIRGRCTPPDAGGPDACVVTATPVRRGVLIVMAASLGIAVNASSINYFLFGDAGLVTRRQDTIDFGAAVHAGCRNLSVVPVGPGTAAAIAAVIPSLAAAEAPATETMVRQIFDGGAPLGAFGAADAAADPEGRVVLLFVADPPEGCDGGAGTTFGVQAALSDVRKLGLRTVVAGFRMFRDGGYALDTNDVTVMGTSGGLPGVAPSATDFSEIRDLLADLEEAVVTCNFTLSPPPRPGLESALSVTLDETPLLEGDVNGYAISDAGVLSLKGAMCTYRKSRSVTVHATAPCEALLP